MKNRNKYRIIVEHRPHKPGVKQWSVDWNGWTYWGGSRQEVIAAAKKQILESRIVEEIVYLEI